MIPIAAFSVMSVVAASAFAQAPQEGWSDPDGAPATVGAGGGIVAVDATTFFVVRGSSGREFFKLTISPGRAWTKMADIPMGVTLGGSVTRRPGTNLLYLANGAMGTGKRGFHRYDIDTNTWTALAAFPVDESEGLSIAATSDRIHALAGKDTAGLFYEYSPDSDSWTPRAPTPAATGAGAGLAAAGASLFALRGGGSAEAWKYSIGSDSWSAVASLPTGVYAGGAIAAKSSAILHALTGDPGDPVPSAAGLYRYDVPLNTWTPLGSATLPGPTGTGAGIASPPDVDGIQVLRGGLTSHLWSYSISSGRFESALAPAPVIFGAGASAVAVGSELFVLQGGLTTGFFKYSSDDDRWSTLEPTPGPVGAGASLLQAGGSYLYAMQGKGPAGTLVTIVGLWRYAIATTGAQEAGTWVALEPLNVRPTGAQSFPSLHRAVWGGGDLIYAPAVTLAGYTRIVFLVYYSISGNRWGYAHREVPARREAPDGTISLVYPGRGPFLYEFEGYNGFNVYCMSRENTPSGPWNVREDGTAFDPKDIAFGIYSNASTLCPSPSGDEIYALPGNAQIDLDGELYSYAPGAFWVYSIAADTWTRKGQAPGSIGLGTTLTSSASSPFTHALAGSRTRTVWMRGPMGPPDPPVALAQFRADGTTPIAKGGSVRADAVSFGATIPLAAGLRARLEVELTAEGGASTAIVAISPLQSRPPWLFSRTGLPPGSYGWRARSVSPLGAASSWVDFGSGGTDFTVAMNGIPSVQSPGQFRLADGSALPAGQATADGIRLGGTPADPDLDLARLEFEVRPFGVPFTGVATSSTPMIAPGERGSAEERLEAGAYWWRVRSIDEWDGVTASWVRPRPGGGGADFNILAVGSTGTVPGCGQSAGPGHAVAALLLMILPSMRRRR